MRGWAQRIGILLAILFPSVVLAVGVVQDFEDANNWNVRIDGDRSGDMFSYSANGPLIADVDSNGEVDLLIGAWFSDNSGRNDSGSVWIILDTLLQDHISDIGTTFEISATSTWNMRLDGATSSDWLSIGGIIVEDLNNNGDNDLIVAAIAADFTNPSGSGSIYILYDDLLDNYVGTGNVIDLSSTSSFSVRVDGAVAGHGLGTIGALEVADMDDDDNSDLLVGTRVADYSGSNTGSLYIIDDSILDDYVGTGNIINLATTTNFTARFDGHGGNAFFSHGLPDQVDLDGNGKTDLIAGAYGRSNTFADSGSLYIIYDTILDDISGTGNIYPLASSTNYNIRLSGYDKHALFASNMAIGDIDNDNKLDLLVSAYDAPEDPEDHGYAYLFYGSSLDDYVGTGNTAEVNASSSYNISFRGNWATHGVGQTVGIADINLDGLEDVLLYGRNAEDGLNVTNGFTYVLYNDIFSALTGTGNVHTILDTSDYSIRYDGANPGDFLGEGVRAADVNNDGRKDIVIPAQTADFSESGAGSMYIALNFPHTLSTSGSTTIAAEEDDTVIITGTISALVSPTTVGGVSYRVDDDTPTAAWTDCAASDGTFDETSESFSCAIEDLSVGAHTTYVRTYDENMSLTRESLYVSYTLNIASSTEPEPEPEENNDNGGRTRSSGGGGGNDSSPAAVIATIRAQLIVLLQEVIRLLMEEVARMTQNA